MTSMLTKAGLEDLFEHTKGKLSPVFRISAQYANEKKPHITIAKRGPFDPIYDAEQNALFFDPEDAIVYEVGRNTGMWLYHLASPPVISGGEIVKSGVFDGTPAEADASYRRAAQVLEAIAGHYAGLVVDEKNAPRSRDQLKAFISEPDSTWKTARAQRESKTLQAMRIAEILYFVEPLQHFQTLLELNVDEARGYLKELSGMDILKR